MHKAKEKNNRLGYFLLKRLITPDLFEKPIHATIACRSQSKRQFSGVCPSIRGENSRKFCRSIPLPEASNYVL